MTTTTKRRSPPALHVVEVEPGLFSVGGPTTRGYVEFYFDGVDVLRCGTCELDISEQRLRPIHDCIHIRAVVQSDPARFGVKG